MALHVDNWSRWPGLVWLDRIAQARPVTRPTTVGKAERPPLARGERILAVSKTIGDQPAAYGSTRALYYRCADRPDDWVRIGWEELDRASWRPEQSTLVLTRCPGDEREPITLRLHKPGKLPEVIRDRINAAVITTNLMALDPGLARITVRRRLGTDSLVWTVQLSSGLDPADPDVQHRVDAAIRTMRADLGLQRPLNVLPDDSWW